MPAGFKLAQDSGTDVTKGIVIEDANAGDSNTQGNQYVWIPIGDVKTDENGTIISVTLGRYEFDVIYNDTNPIEGTGDATLRQSADDYMNQVTIQTNYQEVLNSNYGNMTAKNLGDFITKAKKAGGYYIGRYEAGKVNENPDTFNIKRGQEVYDNVTQSNATTLARNLYSSNNNFESDLINSYTWDTALTFIQTFSEDTDYSKQNGLQDTITTTGNAHDSDNNYDVRCNIYDMAGNVQEWSTETYLYQDYSCVARGGNGYYISPAYRGSGGTEHSVNFIGFRTILYL